MSRIPLTWPELHNHFAARNNEEPHSLATTVVARIQRRVPQVPIGRLLLGSSDILSRVAIMIGPEPCRKVFAAQAPYFNIALADAAKPGVPGASMLIQLMLLGYGNVARCIGDSSVVLDEHALVERLVRGATALDEIEQEELAVACIAVGSPEYALKVLEYNTLPSFKPGEKFGPNMTGFIYYLCAALASGATAQDVQPAWQDFYLDFPYKLATQTIRWSTLLWLARVVFGRIGGLPDGDVVNMVRSKN